MKEPKYDTVDPFDRQLGDYHGIPDSVHSRPTTIQISNLVETSAYIVQTYRMPDQGDTIFLQQIGKNGAIRIAIPPAVSAVIARQRDALATMKRRQIGKANAPRLREMAAERKAAGIEPAFMKNRGKRKARKGPKSSG